MRIGNPLFDAVIKFMLEDNVIAKDFLSVLLEEQIVSLELRPQERTIVTENGLSVMRLDFKALIKTKSKKLKKVLIEFQKSKSGLQLRRFRQYLGLNYMEDDEVPSGRNGHIKKGSLPILTIYVMGFSVAGIDTPILQVKRTYKDMVGNKVIKPHKYVENLTHDSLIIQIPRLHMTAHSAMERVLDVFNEVKYKTDNPHILEYTGDTTDPVINRMVKRLSMAITQPDVLHALLVQQLEDEEVALRAEKMKKNEKKLEAQDKKIEEKDKKIEEVELKAESERKAKEEAEHRAETEHKENEKAQLEIVNLKKQLAEALKNNNKND